MSDDRLNIDPNTIAAVEQFRQSHRVAVLVIMFADMVDSTGRREMMGEIPFELVRGNTDDILREVLVPDKRGLLLKSTGDGQLLVFAEPDQAVKRALGAQDRLRGTESIPVRIGIDMGQVAVDESGTSRDVFGRQVNRAARIEALGDGGHVLVSYPVWDSAKGWLGHDLSISWREHRNCRLRGFAGTFSVFEAFKPGVTVPLAHLRGQRPPAIDRTGSDWDRQPAIAVLPFKNFSSSPDQVHLSDGIADDVTNELASLRLFPVIARNSTFALRGETVDISQLGRKLGARYIVEGSFDRIGQRIRISARLVDAVTGIQLASERFDRPVDELPEVRDQVTEMIVGSLAPEVLRAERQRAMQRPSKNHPTSYECFLRGLEAHYRYTKVDNAEAQRHFGKAIDADPRNAQAHALLASAMLHAVQLGWREDVEHNYNVADQFASRAVALDPRAPFAHFSLGSTSMFLGRIDQALREMREAVRINPSHAAAHVIMAHLLCYVGRSNDALESVNRGLRLSPYDPRLGLWLPAASQAHYFLKNYEEAAAVGQQALSLIPENPLGQRFAAASLGQIGRLADAAWIVAALRRSSVPSIEAIRTSVTRLYRQEQMIEHMLEGLRKAGLE